MWTEIILKSIKFDRTHARHYATSAKHIIGHAATVVWKCAIAHAPDVVSTQQKFAPTSHAMHFDTYPVMIGTCIREFYGVQTVQSKKRTVRGADRR